MKNTFKLFGIITLTAIIGFSFAALSLTACGGGGGTGPIGPILVSIEVTPPTKTQYNIGDTIDLSGMVVMATYSDDTTAVVTIGYTINGFDSSTAGRKTITVSYGGQTAEFTVEVIAPIFSFDSIADFATWLRAQPDNTAATAYNVKLNVSNISGISTPLRSNATKYVNLDLSGSTFTSIGSGAFSSCTSLTSVTIGNSVTTIGVYAFSKCTSLTSVTIPDSVTSIGGGAFSGCTSLTSITIPFVGATLNGTTHFGVIFGASSYYGQNSSIPSSLKTVIITGGSIADYAFDGCTNLTSVTIGNSVTSIGQIAFQGCTNLASVTIGNSVTSIGRSPFSGCTSLTSITIPFVGAPFGDHIFGVSNSSIPSSLKTVIITRGSSIGSSAFYGCTGLTSVTIPDSVTSIGYSAFSSCTSLTSITIPDSVTSIGYSAFQNCTKLTSVTIGNGVTIISDSVFNGCTSLTSVIIGNSVEGIGYYAFSGCRSLTSVTIPASVNRIRDYAFSSTGLTSVTIPNSVTLIGIGAFEGCTNLTSVTIPNSVTSIGNMAFLNCIRLTSVTFEGTISSSNFDGNAFFSSQIGDLREKYLAVGGGIGTYTRPDTTSTTWTKQ